MRFTQAVRQLQKAPHFWGSNQGNRSYQTCWTSSLCQSARNLERNLSQKPYCSLSLPCNAFGSYNSLAFFAGRISLQSFRATFALHRTTRLYHNENQFTDQKGAIFRPHPFNRRFAYSKKSFFPIEPRNLRLPGLKKKKRRGRGTKSSAKGIRKKHDRPHSGGPNDSTKQGGETPLYKRLPKWPEATRQKYKKEYEPLNLCKIRTFLEEGRLDGRFPITQRHLHDSRCCKVKNGIRLFNVNAYPFPYKIDIEVATADQSSIDAIKHVGGTVTIVYLNRLNLRAHLKPFKFEVLPQTARPPIASVLFLEKMRARGCAVRYIKPLWLIEEEQRMKAQLMEQEAITRGFSETPSSDDGKGGDNSFKDVDEEELLQRYRLRYTAYAQAEQPSLSRPK
ncbi:putative ribosomal protein L15 [Cardiosporidium cionae]|uniref:Ribosomal protein L15 n=1 Tax=Cardiosporidium cionae TaxID=476202 RepID=A0ABQ7J5N9_9APIC|nr:putative ribosomal protein L15 [Cardiosporidium cionae]|eukprot:KAF8819010.1 putative ribosomal protein L15 [Cardiosporidium cionae]